MAAGACSWALNNFPCVFAIKWALLKLLTAFARKGRPTKKSPDCTASRRRGKELLGEPRYCLLCRYRIGNSKTNANMASEPGKRNQTPGSAAELMSVALPLIISSGSIALMYVVDRIFLTWYSQEALAASLPAGMLFFTIISVALGMSQYTNTFVAQYEGAKRKDRVSASVWQGVYLSACTGAILLAVVPFSDRIFSWIGHDPEVQQQETEYFSVMCLGATPILLASVLACFFSGRGKTLVIMYVNVFGSLINVGLNYVLIFGHGPWPAWGIRGAAVATVIANVVTVLVYVFLFSRKDISSEYETWTNWRFDRELFARFIRYGFPNGVQFFVDFAGFTIFVLLVGQLGKTELAATSLAFNLNTLAFVPMLGIGTAVSTLVGKRIGENRPALAIRTTWIAFIISAAYMLVFVAIYLFLPDLILMPYAAYAEIDNFENARRHVVLLLRFVALYSFFDAMVIVFGSAVRGAGDTRFSLIFVFVAGWSLMVLPTFVAWAWYGGSLWVSWSACTAYIVVLGVGFLIRFRGGRWQSMRVIEHEAPIATESIIEIEPA